MKPILQRLLAIPLLALAVMALSVAPARGATALRLGLEDLVANASDVVVAQVIATSSTRDERGRIHTDVTLSVGERLKGQSPSHLTIRLPGGRVDDLAMYVPGLPYFSEGEQVLVFLDKPAKEHRADLVGMSQGKFRIVLAPDGHTRVALPELVGLHLVERAPASSGKPEVSARAFKAVTPDDLHRSPVRLEDLEARIRAIVARSAGESTP